ncbi:MAG: proline--tRNA ligase, partial [Lentisphaeraceae bacterium]|nr:proline--tRNA ligase [Lentisphaeraceae bacterium]
MARTEITSYKQMPSAVYQIQTKYRDEARPRAGLIRVREFTMKDAYSFHADQECLEAYYETAHQAYENIFRRVGMNDVRSIESDNGMIGGTCSHEFMAISDIGEDTIFASPDRRYKANREIAVSPLKFKKEEAKELEKVHTPAAKTIEEVSTFLKCAPEDTAKAVFYGSEDTDKLILVVIRGDIDVNETKLRNHLKYNSLYPALDEQIVAAGSVVGYASPIGLNLDKVQLIVDPSVAESSNLVSGSSEADYHYVNSNYGKDYDGGEVIDVATVRAGDPCPVTGEPLEELSGIEVGNIFQLGTKYSENMKANFLDQNGKSKPIVMGCYGIGVGRAMASVVEQSNDEYGPIWPLSIAPYHVHLIGLDRHKEGIADKADEFYAAFKKAGIEVIYDDRKKVRAGFAFNDADLIGVPYRLVLSPKLMKEAQVEFKTRDGEINEKLDIDSALAHVIELIKGKLAEL